MTICYGSLELLTTGNCIQNLSIKIKTINSDVIVIQLSSTTEYVGLRGEPITDSGDVMKW